MNERIKELAEQADEFANNWFPPNTYNSDWQEVRDKKFAELIRADEREACAKLVDKFMYKEKTWYLKDIPSAIRARGEEND